MSIFIPSYRPWFSFLVLDLIRYIAVGIWRSLDILERKSLELVRRQKDSLYKTDTHTELVIDDPNLIDINDSRNLLALLKSTQVDKLLLRVVRLGDETSVAVSQDLDTKGRCILSRILALTDVALEEIGRLDHIRGINLSENLKGVLCDVIEYSLLKPTDPSKNIRIIQGQINAVRSLASLGVGVRTQAEWCAEYRELETSLAPYSVDVDGLSSIAGVLLELREYN